MLSILICSLNNRQRQLHTLLDVLNKQKNKHVDIHVEQDDGKQSIGDKRNLLLRKSTRMYSCFVDDDDLVTHNYVELLLDSITAWHKRHGEYPDCVGMVGIVKRRGKPDFTFRHSITVGKWCQDSNRRIYFRTPNHLNPIKTEIAKRVGFPSVNWGEDRNFSDRIKPFLKTESWVEQPIYIYQVGNH